LANCQLSKYILLINTIRQSWLVLKGRQLKVLSEQIKSKFSGKLAKDQKSIKRLWKQRLLPLPLTLHFSDEKPAGE